MKTAAFPLLFIVFILQKWTCNAENNIITAIKEIVTTHMSSVCNETLESYLAIDGNIGPDIITCKCCAETQNEAVSWWSIDLMQKYPIDSITLFGRNKVAGFGQQLEGFEIFLSNTSSFDQTTSYKDNSEHIANAFIVQLHNQLARFIKVQRPGVLTLCEVSVQEGECAIGYFGTECSMVCKCFDKKPCRRTDGVCSTPSCELGWKGAACDSECLPGTFGEECRKKCFCADGEICTKDYGICPGRCKPGHHGPQCNEGCSSGSFGEDCSHICNCKGGTTCDSFTGFCQQRECAPGWQGDACDIQCSSGSFGEGCSHICNCKGGTTCDSVTGFCQKRECDPGWQGDACDIQCDSLKFGDGCNNTCHCSSCEPVNGTCHTECDLGWAGSSCSQARPTTVKITQHQTTSTAETMPTPTSVITMPTPTSVITMPTPTSVITMPTPATVKTSPSTTTVKTMPTPPTVKSAPPITTSSTQSTHKTAITTTTGSQVGLPIVG